MSLLAFFAGRQLDPLPDLIGERPVPYSLPLVSGYKPPEPAITPTYDGSGETVHPAVVDMLAETGAPFRGFRYWMGITPYPGSDSKLENPSILVSNYGWEWQQPQGIVNPLDKPVDGPPGSPTGGYNSDTELVWDPDAGRLVLYWRRAFEELHAAESRDGIHWTRHWNVLSAGAEELISPSIARRGPGDWMLWAGGMTRGIRVYTAPSPLGPWTLADVVPAPGGITNHWHHSVWWDAESGRFFWAGTSRGWAMYPAVSADGLTWSAGAPIAGGPSSYRPTLTRADDPDWYDYWDRWSQWRTGYSRVPRSLWTDLIV